MAFQPQLAFEVYRKRGRGWEYLDIYHETDSRKAARHAGYVHNLKVLGVRPESSTIKLQVFRFQYVPSITG